MIKQSKGFTLLEVLVTLSIFLIVASVIPHFFNVIKQSEPKHLQRMEVSLFFQQLANDIQQAATISVVNNTLYLEKNKDETVTYGYFTNRIRRQINNKGQEIALQNVQNVKFSKWKNGIEVTIIDTFKETYQKRLSHLLPLEEMGHG